MLAAKRNAREEGGEALSATGSECQEEMHFAVSVLNEDHQALLQRWRMLVDAWSRRRPRPSSTPGRWT